VSVNDRADTPAGDITGQLRDGLIVVWFRASTWILPPGAGLRNTKAWLDRRPQSYGPVSLLGG